LIAFIIIFSIQFNWKADTFYRYFVWHVLVLISLPFLLHYERESEARILWVKCFSDLIYTWILFRKQSIYDLISLILYNQCLFRYSRHSMARIECKKGVLKIYFYKFNTNSVLKNYFCVIERQVIYTSNSKFTMKWKKVYCKPRIAFLNQIISYIL